MKDFTPWEHYNSLSPERLILLATTIRDARDRAVMRHDPESGDNSWSTHCAAYAWQCKALRTLVKHHNWLRVSSENHEVLELSLVVGDIPLKVFRGDADESPVRHRGFSFGEQVLMEKILADLPSGPLRLVVTTDKNFCVEAITLVQFDDETPWRAFQIPLDGGSSFSAPKPDPVAPPPILPHTDDPGQDSATSRPAV